MKVENAAVMDTDENYNDKIHHDDASQDCDSASIETNKLNGTKQQHPPKQTIFDMIEDCLTSSLVIFLYADLRELSATGRINTKFETLSVDSDLVPRYTAAQLAGMAKNSQEEEQEVDWVNNISPSKHPERGRGGKYINGVSPAQIMAILLVELRREVRAQKRLYHSKSTPSTPHATPNKHRPFFYDEEEDEEEDFSLLRIIQNKETRKKALEDDMQSLMSLYNLMIAKDLNYKVPDIPRSSKWLWQRMGAKEGEQHGDKVDGGGAGGGGATGTTEDGTEAETGTTEGGSSALPSETMSNTAKWMARFVPSSNTTTEPPALSTPFPLGTPSSILQLSPLALSKMKEKEEKEEEEGDECKEEEMSQEKEDNEVYLQNPPVAATSKDQINSSNSSDVFDDQDSHRKKRKQDDTEQFDDEILDTKLPPPNKAFRLFKIPASTDHTPTNSRPPSQAGDEITPQTTRKVTVSEKIFEAIDQHRQKPFTEVSDVLFQEMNIVHPKEKMTKPKKGEEKEEDSADLELSSVTTGNIDLQEINRDDTSDGAIKLNLATAKTTATDIDTASDETAKDAKQKKKNSKHEKNNNSSTATKLTEDELLDLMEDAAESRVHDRLNFMSGFFKEKSVSQLLIKSKLKIVWVNDWFPLKDLIYVITVDTEKRIVMLAFRGCVTKADWNHSFDAKWKKVRNPIPESSSFSSSATSSSRRNSINNGDVYKRPQTIKVHRGFHRYLFRRRKDTGTCKYDEICTKLHEYSTAMGGDCLIHATGHSLGGALATLFGFYASTDERFTKNGPIRVINFGSPYVGGHAFAASFRHQERSSKVQLARIHNARDAVTHLPFNMTLSKKGSKFQHVGIGVELPRVKKVPLYWCSRRYPSITYVGDESYFASYWRAIKNNVVFHLPLPWKIKFVHKLFEHHKRLVYGRTICLEKKHPLSEMSLDDIYKESLGKQLFSRRH